MSTTLVLVACLCMAADAFRAKQNEATTWSAVAGEGYGQCRKLTAALNKGEAYFDLVCSKASGGVKLATQVRGYKHNVWIQLNHEKVSGGYKLMPLTKQTRTVTVTLGNLAAGRHQLRYYGSGSGALYVQKLTLSGSGNSCKFDNPRGNYSSAFFTGIDALISVFGNKRFPMELKNRISYTMKTIGTSEDQSIKTDKVAEGMFDILFEHSQNQSKMNDYWGSLDRKYMYKESDSKPWPTIKLSGVRGLKGNSFGSKTMVIQEPCNTLSNFVFFQSAFHLSCMDRRGLTANDMAALVSSLMAMGAGSVYFHASGSNYGRAGDVLGMQNFFFYAYQVSVRGVLEKVGNGISSSERDLLTHFGTGADGYKSAQELSRVLGDTSMTFIEKNQALQVQKRNAPNYMLSIVAWIQFSVHAIRHYLSTDIINYALEIAAGAAGADNVNFSPHLKAVLKALDSMALCQSKKSEARTRFVQFSVSMIQALIFQESIIKLPSALKTTFNLLVKAFEAIGLGVERFSVIGPAWGVYNGQDKRCSKSSHAMWHEYAAHGIGHMLELMQILQFNMVRGDGKNC